MLTTVASGRVYDYSYCIGAYGMAGQAFGTPYDFALGRNGHVYVVNRGAEGLGQRVTMCTVDHEFLGAFGSYGSGEGQFIWPNSLELDREENVYISDDYLNRISVYDKEGTYLSHWGQSGSGEGELRGPAGIAFDSYDNLYVVDCHNSRVQKFTQEGKFLGHWGRQGSNDGEFNLPWGICLDRESNVYVADWKNNRVQKFSPDGQMLVKFEGSLGGVGDLQRPTGVAVDSDGDVYVTDWGNERLQVYAPDGSFIASLVGDAQQPSPWAETWLEASPSVVKARRRVNLEPEWRFGRPVAVNVDDQDRIFVLESWRGRIQVYNKDKEYEDFPLSL
jgi:DNA-binding beta-propeller fold protein YncE